MEIKVWRTSCENPFQTGSKVVKSKKMLYTYAIRIWKRIRTQEVTMGRYLNPGMESFEKSVNSEIYVDKTGLVGYTNRVMNTVQGYVCVSRPRRFGKSMAANMLTAYYSRGCDSEEMFSPLQISGKDSFKRYLNKYDVLHFDIQWCLEPAGGPENVVAFLSAQVIRELKSIYPDIVPDEIKSLPDALSAINTATGNKFIVIIDEWDVLIRDEADNIAVQEEYINFLRGMFKGTEPTRYIALAYMTGILPIKKLKTQSALNNFDEFTMLDAGILAPFVGFTEKEVRQLCTEYHRDFEKVKSWYDGYLLDDQQIYNPKAVVNVMQRGNFRSYWSQTASYELVVPLINMDFDGLKTAIIEMISGSSVEVDTGTFQNDTVSFADRDDVITYLIHLGYLAYDQTRGRTFIPNEEIRQEFLAATKRKKWNELLEFEQQSMDLLEATLDMDEAAVAEAIEKIHMGYASVIQYNNENTLSSVLSIAYLSTLQYYFKPVRELPTGRGFADFVYLPKPEYLTDYPALVVELKWNKKAETALQQIKDKKYPASIRQYTGNILLVGISYDKKSRKYQCVIETDEK